MILEKVKKKCKSETFFSPSHLDLLWAIQTFNLASQTHLNLESQKFSNFASNCWGYQLLYFFFFFIKFE